MSSGGLAAFTELQAADHRLAYSNYRRLREPMRESLISSYHHIAQGAAWVDAKIGCQGAAWHQPSGPVIYRPTSSGNFCLPPAQYCTLWCPAILWRHQSVRCIKPRLMCIKAVQPGAALRESLFIEGYKLGADLHPVPVKELRALSHSLLPHMGRLPALGSRPAWR